MNESAHRGLENRLWGIYHVDRKYARVMGDPLRTVVEAPNKVAAEEVAARLGFGEAWAQPIAPDQVQQAQWLPGRRPRHRQDSPKPGVEVFVLEGKSSWHQRTKLV